MYKKNTLLELWRFFFCIAVLAFHISARGNFSFFHAGYLGVEFFFVVSGFFIGSYYAKHQASRSFVERIKTVPRYGLSRLKRLYPLYILALVLMLLIKTYAGGNGEVSALNRMITLFKNCFTEFLLLQWSPIGNEVLISAGWFVPAVFWGGIFYVGLLAFTGKVGGLVIAPLISFFLYRYYFLLIGKIDVIYAHHSVLRGIAGIGFGVFIYFVCDRLKGFVCAGSLKYQREDGREMCVIGESEIGKSEIGKSEIGESKTGESEIEESVIGSKERFISALNIGLNMVAGAIFLSVFVYTNYGRRSKWDFLVIGLYGLGMLLLMMSSVKLPARLEKLFLALGKITYPVYVLQMPVIELFFLF